MPLTKKAPVLFHVLIILALSSLSFLKIANARKTKLIDDIYIPGKLTLFNEKLPLEKQSSYEMLERELIISACDRAQVFMWIKRSGRYFPFIEKELQKKNLPDDLKYLAVAESALITHTQSPAGAVGPWQFIKRTARENGLKKDRLTDERLNFENSTEAALNHLSRLHNTFNSWTLAAAAYNCGVTRLKRAIKEQKVNNYFRLNLPLETERYIYRIAAVKLILENPEKYGFNVPQERVYKPIKCDSVEVFIKTPLHITEIAREIGLDYKDIKELNPQFLGYYLPEGKHRLKVPPGMGSPLITALNKLTKTAQKMKNKYPGNFYTVRQGDTLGHISERTGMSVRTLRQLNNIKGSLIRVGQKLKLR